MKSEEFKLPEGWKWVKLGEVIRFIKGKPPKVFYESQAVNSVRYLTPEYLRRETNETLYCDSNSVEVANDNIVILWDGSNAGEVFYCKGGAIASTMAKVIVPSEQFHPKYLYYYFKSYEPFIKHQVKGSGIPHVEKDIFNILPNIFPPLPEQQKIAEILETVDNAIEKTEKIIEKYKHIKQGLMQELLTKGIDENWQIRSEKTHKFKDSPLGRIPEEWEVVRLGEIIILNPEKLTYSKGEMINYIDIESVADTKIKAIKLFKIEEAPSRAQRVVKSKDIIVSTVRPNLKAFALIPQDYDDYVCSSGFAVLRAKNKVEPFYLFYLTLYDDIFLKQVLPLVVGSNYPAVNSYELLNIKIPLPPLPEQQRIAEVLSQVDEVIEKEENYKRKLESLKRGLMEDLLTGKVRVNPLLEM